MRVIRGIAIVLIGMYFLADALALSQADAAGIHTARLTVSEKGVVQHSSLPHCAVEDGGPDLPCTWNVGPTDDGNSGGLSYWVGRDQRIHYVWNLLPNTGHWRWVGHQLADALAEGDRPMADTRPWERCVTKWVPFGEGRHRWVKCPDGLQLLNA